MSLLTTTTLSAAVHDALRESITRGEYAPGSVITEAAVTQRYGVARPTAKAALEGLVAEGLLLRTENRAARVPVLDIPDIVDLYDSRLVIEEAVMRRLAERRLVPKDAQTANRELIAHSEEGDETLFTKADIGFHRALVEASGSPRLIRMHSTVLGETQLCMRQVRALRVMPPIAVAAEHQSLLNTLESGDINLASELIRRHIEGVRDGLVAARRYD
jgi:DNA-binding GntR family transcriptional regulator